MVEKDEPRFIDYIAIGILGFAVGQAITGVGGISTAFLNLFGRIDWGSTVANDVVTGLFAFLPGGFVAGYLCYRLLKGQESGEGLTGGIMSFVAYFFITLIITISSTAIDSGNWGTALSTWAVLMVFALIFFPIGGFLADKMHGMKSPLPSVLRLRFQRQAGPSTPPPPPGTGMTCPTCGSPLRYIEEYKRWYCDKERKYV